MSQEIVYTSAPKGLKAGSRGFCTVASTSGMAVNLAERLESLSGYRHAYLPHEEKASLNPVNYSHQTVTVGGRKYHVLSRICNAGLDYTKRSNKLAHHVALDQREAMAAPGGPAWVLNDDDFCVTQWSGDPRHLQSGRAPRTDDCPQGKCVTWAKATGDAGWAGVLAESLEKNAGRPMSIIFKPETDTLQLLVEAISLLPVEKRWNVTFSTYCTNAASDAQWRFLLEGTDEATKIQRNPHTPKIDLTQDLGRAEGGELVGLARGDKAQPALGRPAAPKMARRVAPGAKRQDELAASDMEKPTAPLAVPTLEGEPMGPAAPPVEDKLNLQLSKPKKSPVRLALYGIVAAVLFIGTPVAILMLAQDRNKNDRSQQIVQDALGNKNEDDKEIIVEPQNQDDKDNQNPVTQTSSTQNTENTTEVNSTEAENRGDGGNKEPEPPPTYGAPKFQEAPKDQSVIAGAELTVDVNATSDRPEAKLRYSLVDPPAGAAISDGKFRWTPTVSQSGKSHPLKVTVEVEGHPKDGRTETTFAVDVPHPFAKLPKGRVLDLPKQSVSLTGRGQSTFGHLATLLLDPSVNLQLKLAGLDLTQDKESEVNITADETESGKWTLRQNKKDSKALAPSKPKEVATFKLENKSLQFRWGDAIPKFKPGACLLVFQVNGLDNQVCKLTKPKEVQPIPIGFQSACTSAEIPVDEGAIPGRDHLLIDVQVEGFPGKKSGPTIASGLAIDSNRTIQFPGGKQGGPLLELAIALQWEDGKEKPDLLIKPYAFPIEEISGEQQRVQLVTETSDESGNTSNVKLPNTLKKKAENIRGSADPKMKKFAEQLAEKEQLLKPYKEDLAKLNSEIAKLEAQVTKLKEAKKKAQKEGKQEQLARLDEMLNSIDKKLGELNVAKAEINNTPAYQTLDRLVADFGKKLDVQKRLQRNAAANIQYAEQLSQLIKTLESSGEIHYRLYFKVEEGDIKEKVVVLQTSMFAVGN